ncbi:hypothetical protein QCA50_002839 [Cerrena zonata]|uniref:Uncharacterized protein n=1 Tax=Cerrena zonata TaxID=2478898 RepID=A0AAW0GMY3_9APHY
MLRNASKTAKIRPIGTSVSSRRCFSQGTYSRTQGSASGSRVAVASTAVVVTAAALYFSKSQPVHNDAPKSTDVRSKKADDEGPAVTFVDDESLNSMVWGSNKTHVLLPSEQTPESVKVPVNAEWLKDVALRDLALHERHAACVDAKGDLYQWGDGFFGEGASSSSERKPLLTLRGKNIVKIQVTPSRVFALSASGRIYTLASEQAKQQLATGAQTPASTPWWGTGWLWDEEQTVDFAEIKSDGNLKRGETFISIATGNDHLLALTSTGRAFAHPINLNANAYGQLGFRKVDIPDHSPIHIGVHPPGHIRIPLELIPKSIEDPYAKSTPAIRRASSSSEEKSAGSPSPILDDSHIRFSDKLFEVPSLKGIRIDQIAAGGRSSFVKTAEGRVLGWGANEYGQIGLGGNVTLDTITVPTEVVLWKATPQATRSTCLSVAAGGDLTLFSVERKDGTAIPYVDVLSCGNGQWGGLGNALYSNAQGTPLRARAVSGLLEYSESTNNLQPIQPYSISVSPTGHVLLTLDTLSRSGPGAGGRDLLVWGANFEYQLGNGKRGSSATPRNLESLEGDRFMLGKRKAKEVRDLVGKVWKRGVDVEQCAVAGYGNSVVYWRICS